MAKSKELNLLITNMGSQIVIPPNYNIGATMPFVFTEAGVAMLSAILKSVLSSRPNPIGYEAIAEKYKKEKK